VERKEGGFHSAAADVLAASNYQILDAIDDVQIALVAPRSYSAEL
jgi:hypothetical protein